jgi:hypothetical protein
MVNNKYHTLFLYSEKKWGISIQLTSHKECSETKRPLHCFPVVSIPIFFCWVSFAENWRKCNSTTECNWMFGKSVHYPAPNWQKGSVKVQLHYLDIDTRQRWVISLTIWSFQWGRHCYPVEKQVDCRAIFELMAYRKLPQSHHRAGQAQLVSD